MTTIARSTSTRTRTSRPSAGVAGGIEVVAGVDTHRDTHTAAVLDTTGRVLGHREFGADGGGYTALWDWVAKHGNVRAVGVEGTGSYGAGLSSYLLGQGVEVIEVDRPDRKTRRRAGKSDPIDAEAAARTVVAGARNGTPKDRRSQVEALRNLRVARRSAIEQRADCLRRIKTLIITAPETLRAQLRCLDGATLVGTCAGLRPDRARIDDPAQAAKVALRSLARTHQSLSEEIEDLEDLIGPLVEAINPTLTRLNGVGPDTAGQLLVTAGANPERIRSEAAFAMLCGVAPIPASSGQTRRYRLNRGGDRQANAALYRVVLSRLRWDPETQAYARRRTAQGLSKKDIIRCLKRYVAREVYRVLTTDSQAPMNPATAA